MTDNAGYTDQVFGLFRLLGYQFSPRLADLGDARFWRTKPDADYGSLNVDRSWGRGVVRGAVVSWEDVDYDVESHQLTRGTS